MAEQADKPASSAPASPDQVAEELERINSLAQATRDPLHRIELWAQYRALNWARSPTGFAPPSEERQPERKAMRKGAHLVVVRT